jgi:hypothetical protein
LADRGSPFLGDAITPEIANTPSTLGLTSVSGTSRRRVWTRRSIVNVGDGRKVLESGHRIMRVLNARPWEAVRRRDFVTFVARATAVWPGIALAQQSAGKVWRVAYPYPSMHGPYKKIDAALGDDRMR